ncbi:MAG: cob(I)yrinic acid a,c-diamide adenosyltransferase [Candidatus Omnitrophica bacterium]|jgi:cob(I)alamin adenosyltransferase|nr:cob(I)yrinic acid a,c-diamide adenosyltransferase [Candidatus Omnitrophota bacterium]
MIQVYTGCGKGKTTASLGLALRASGAGLKVYILQFLKKNPTSELKAISFLSGITVEQCGRSDFVRAPGRLDKLSARKGLKRLREVLENNSYDLIILDEINLALHFNLIKQEDLMRIIKTSRHNTEWVLTGRNAPQAIINKADLVSYIKCVKHYFNKGRLARKGFEF